MKFVTILTIMISSLFTIFMTCIIVSDNSTIYYPQIVVMCVINYLLWSCSVFFLIAHIKGGALHLKDLDIIDPKNGVIYYMAIGLAMGIGLAIILGFLLEKILGITVGLTVGFFMGTIIGYIKEFA